MTSQSEYERTEGPEENREGPTVLTPTEARQGEIILGRRGRMLWIAILGIVVVIGLAAAII